MTTIQPTSFKWDLRKFRTLCSDVDSKQPIEGIYELLKKNAASPDLDTRALAEQDLAKLLQVAARLGRTDLVVKLTTDLDHCYGSVHTPLRTAIQRALTLACRYGHEDAVVVFLRHEWDIHDGALMMAVKYGQTAIAKLLIAHGVRPGGQMLKTATRRGHQGVVDLLKKHGVKETTSPGPASPGPAYFCSNCTFFQAYKGSCQFCATSWGRRDTPNEENQKRLLERYLDARGRGFTEEDLRITTTE